MDINLLGYYHPDQTWHVSYTFDVCYGSAQSDGFVSILQQEKIS